MTFFVCVCVWKHLATRWDLHTFNSIFELCFRFEPALSVRTTWKRSLHVADCPSFHVELFQQQQGAGEGGGGSPANEDTPPHPVKTYLHFSLFLREWQEAKPRTSFSTRTPLRRTLWTTISTPMIDYDRTMFLSKRFKRGLWDAIPLPRTTPDKHENYHQCVSSSGCYVIPVGWTFREGPIQSKLVDASIRSKGGPRAMDSRPYSRSEYRCRSIDQSFF